VDISNGYYLLISTIGIVAIAHLVISTVGIVLHYRYQQLVLLRSCITDIDNWNWNSTLTVRTSTEGGGG